MRMVLARKGDMWGGDGQGLQDGACVAINSGTHGAII